MKPTRLALWFTFVAFAWGIHPLSATEIPDRALVKIESQVSGSRQAGTGFIVKKTSDGVYILTAAHVVAGDPKPKVYFARRINQAVPVDRVYMEGAKDEGLAVLFVVRSKLPTDLLALPLATTGPESHHEYHVVGYPRAVGFLSVISGRATRKGSDVVFLAELGDGFSGSPMLRDERVYGIVVTSAANALAVPVDIARVFLKGAGMDAPPPMSVAQLGKWGAEGKGDGRFGRAWGIATSWSGGRVHVHDGHGCIQTFSSSGQFQGRVATNCMGPFLAVDSNGIIYAMNYDSGTGRNERVEVYSPDGHRRGVFHLVGQAPRAIDADIYGHNIYVADIGVNQIFHYNQSGQLVSRWGAAGSGNGQFRDPWGIAVDRYHTRRVYVADTGNNRVQAFDPNGRFLFVFGSKGSGDGQFERPVDVAVDTGDGNVYVLDQGNNRIQVFSRDGEFLGKWGSAGYKDGEFNDPYGITIDHQDRVFVMDTGNHRVQIFKAEWR